MPKLKPMKSNNFEETVHVLRVVGDKAFPIETHVNWKMEKIEKSDISVLVVLISKLY